MRLNLTYVVVVVAGIGLSVISSVKAAPVPTVFVKFREPWGINFGTPSAPKEVKAELQKLVESYAEFLTIKPRDCPVVQLENTFISQRANGPHNYEVDFHGMGECKEKGDCTGYHVIFPKHLFASGTYEPNPHAIRNFINFSFEIFLVYDEDLEERAGTHLRVVQGGAVPFLLISPGLVWRIETTNLTVEAVSRGRNITNSKFEVVANTLKAREEAGSGRANVQDGLSWSTIAINSGGRPLSDYTSAERVQSESRMYHGKDSDREFYLFLLVDISQIVSYYGETGVSWDSMKWLYAEDKNESSSRTTNPGQGGSCSICKTLQGFSKALPSKARARFQATLVMGR
ncbi:hypothetical protein F5877DRAFT_65283 [Lentinula edodes]|nr:hypothetical protein F5877DRAFT_65283 [Lentinula edodes]